MAKIKLVVSATVEEIFKDFLISHKAKGLADKTLQSYEQQFRAAARHMDMTTDIAMLQQADFDNMIISMRDVLLLYSFLRKPQFLLFPFCAGRCILGSAILLRIVCPAVSRVQDSSPL